MDQNSQGRTYAALGVAGQMGCLMFIFVLGALLVGIWLDQTFHTRRIAIFLCIAVSIPLNLVLVTVITRRLVGRIIPPSSANTATSKMSQGPSGDIHSGEEDS